VARLATQTPGRVPDPRPLTEGPGPTSSPGSLSAPRVSCRCSPVGFDQQQDAVKFEEMFDQAMHHAMINRMNVLMNSIQNAIRETVASGLQMGPKGPCYSQPESSAVATSRAGSAAMAGFGTQPPPLSTVMPTAGSYPMPPCMFQRQTY
jgi:hypothetical protein